MALLSDLLKRRDIWKRIALERLTEPLHLNIISIFVAIFGTTRAKILFDLLVRQQHAQGILRAADDAARRGLNAIAVIEMGVGTGVGLLNLSDLSKRISRITRVKIHVAGFDTGQGLPPPRDFRDHPELYRSGEFAMDLDSLRSRLPTEAKLILGDLRQTVPEFLKTISPDAPIGFVLLDVDYHSSTVDALNLFTGDPRCYLPVVPVYVDDVHLDSHNPFCGAQLAIDEFNAAQPMRKVSFDRFLVHHRVFKHAEWLSHMYKLDVLDHPSRDTKGQ